MLLFRCDSCGDPQLSELQGKHILLCVKNKQATNEIDEIIRDLLNEENHGKYYKWKKLPPVETYIKKLLSFCHKCGISFGDYQNVLNHWNNDHKEEKPKFQCKFSICEYACHKGAQLKAHIDKHLLNAGRHTKCPMCGKVFNKAKLTPHIKQVHTEVEKSAECPKCGKKFKEARHVRKHMKDVHKKKEKKCEYVNENGETCLKSFSQLRHLNFHIKREHKLPEPEDIIVRENSPEAPRANTFHSGNLNDTGALDLSISVISPGEPGSNPSDSQAFVEIKLEVVKEEPDCEEVDDVEVTEKIIPAANTKTAADEPCKTDNLVYCCQECGKAYGRKDVLRKHFRTKHMHKEAEEAIVLKCTACEKTYGRKDCLRKHYKRKHMDIAKKYETFPCNQCDNSYSSRDKLTRHKIQHTAADGKPFRCEECPERFSRKDAMVRHVKRQHNISW